MRALALVLSLATVSLGGCIGPTRQVATDTGRTVSVPTTLTGTQANTSSLILGIQ